VHVLAVGRAHPGVVGGGVDAELAERLGVLLGALAGGGVDQAGLASPMARSTTASRRCSSSRNDCTSSDRLGRSKPLTTTCGSSSRSRRTISSRTGGEAVAVSASTRGRPTRSIAVCRRR
jgi:hypothetical protein